MLASSRDLVRDEIVGKRHERTGSVVRDDVLIFRCRNQIHPRIEVPRVNLVALHDLQTLHFKRPKAEKGCIDRIGIDTEQTPPSLPQVLRKHRRQHRFSDSAFALKH
jgi:hypothetical protein